MFSDILDCEKKWRSNFITYNFEASEDIIQYQINWLAKILCTAFFHLLSK